MNSYDPKRQLGGAPIDLVQVQYRYPYTDNASTKRLAEQIAALIAGEPLMTVAQHQRIVAALSAQQSAHVSVPRELLERTICRLTHGHEHDKAVRELRALLNGGEA